MNLVRPALAGRARASSAAIPAVLLVVGLAAVCSRNAPAQPSAAAPAVLQPADYDHLSQVQLQDRQKEYSHQQKFLLEQMQNVGAKIPDAQNKVDEFREQTRFIRFEAEVAIAQAVRTKFAGQDADAINKAIDHNQRRLDSDPAFRQRFMQEAVARLQTRRADSDVKARCPWLSRYASWDNWHTAQGQAEKELDDLKDQKDKRLLRTYKAFDLELSKIKAAVEKNKREAQRPPTGDAPGEPDIPAAVKRMLDTEKRLAESTAGLFGQPPRADPRLSAAVGTVRELVTAWGKQGDKGKAARADLNDYIDRLLLSAQAVSGPGSPTGRWVGPPVQVLGRPAEPGKPAVVGILGMLVNEGKVKENNALILCLETYENVFTGVYLRDKLGRDPSRNEIVDYLDDKKGYLAQSHTKESPPENRSPQPWRMHTHEEFAKHVEDNPSDVAFSAACRLFVLKEKW